MRLPIIALPFLIASERRICPSSGQPHEEFQGTATWSSFWIPVHDANFLTHLIDKDRHTIGFSYNSCELPHRLGHQTGLQTNVGIPHFPFNFRL